MNLPSLMAGVVLLSGCTLGSSGDFADWDDECREDPYQRSADMAAYHRHTAMNDELREFWAEDQRFYEERISDDCDD